MRIVGVVDLAGGRAVHAVRGQRERYQPVGTVGALTIAPGDAHALARAYLDRVGLRELYAADLDALAGNPPQEESLARLVGLGAPLWLDAGVSSVAAARRALTTGARHVVVALETLPSFEILQEISRAVGRDRVAFSLDLHDGDPIISPGAADAIGRNAPAEHIAAGAADAGAGSLIVIDLGRVGTGRGPDLELIGRVRDATPGVTLLAGGGVRGFRDLEQLYAAGCDGALLATAIHNGRIEGHEVTAAHALVRRGRL